MPVLIHAGGVLDLFASKISLKFVGSISIPLSSQDWSRDLRHVRDKAQEDCINSKWTFCILRACLHGGGGRGGGGGGGG